MARDWESVFTTWSQGPSATEQERAENAERQIRQAILSSEKLRNRDIRVFTQGSYRNRVNVRRDSDVDVGVVCFDTYFPEYPDDNVKLELAKSFVPAIYEYSTFKSELEEALVARFGRGAVNRGAKAFDVKANSYRVESDVCAFFEHRRYLSVGRYHSGVEMIPDDYNPPSIKNWPEQHYDNGVSKNNLTQRRYKRVVRILKNLSNEMAASGVESAKKAPSFLVECLVFNAPNASFNYGSYEPMVREVLANLFNSTISDEACDEWGEVNELKYLFRGSQPWTRQSAHAFLSDAWDYIGYK
ncbi:nucleotidyltransferase domain-containing protein [Pseudomonas chlororaphis]|uniref:nucleotidyltransferase domain-containing protein n=1 Tax=Pseudomonas chlororaphis TaxID=587753 RepID=UPI0024088B19|nr:nucleotidyltransferase [Pseudomonas chlororaphis]